VDARHGSVRSRGSRQARLSRGWVAAGTLDRGVRDPTGPAGDRRDSSRSRWQREGDPGCAEGREGVFARKERERRGGLRRGQRAATDTAAGDYVACRRGTVSSYPRRLPRSDWPGSLPRKRTGFSRRGFSLSFQLTSEPLSARSRRSPLSLSLDPPNCTSFLPRRIVRHCLTLGTAGLGLRPSRMGFI